MKPLFLAIAIVSEVIATSALKASNGFTRLVPSILVLVGYGSALYFLSLTLRAIPVGVAYAIWSGAGVSLITVIAPRMPLCLLMKENVSRQRSARARNVKSCGGASRSFELEDERSEVPRRSSASISLKLL